LEDTSLIKYLIEELSRNEFELYCFSDIHESFASISNQSIKVANKADLSKDTIDIIITLGGDGTMLKAASIDTSHQIPIIGINLGRLGFLSSIEKSKVSDAVIKLKKKQFRIEERSMLKLSSNQSLFVDYPYALNDFTLHKRDTSSMITIHTYLNEIYLNTYWADGVILATPTGSTGYSLACGGPIIFPDSENFVITPIAPHNLNVRPLIINDDVKISFEIEGRADNFLCTMDSRYETITDEYKISITKSPFTTKLLILEGTTFSKTIREKLMWGLDKRN
jgi:NAD+ kinase